MDYDIQKQLEIATSLIGQEKYQESLDILNENLKHNSSHLWSLTAKGFCFIKT